MSPSDGELVRGADAQTAENLVLPAPAVIRMAADMAVAIARSEVFDARRSKPTRGPNGRSKAVGIRACRSTCTGC